MDTEVLGASEAPQQEEVIMEKEAVSKAETPEESTEPEKPPAAAEEPEQLAVNGHDNEVANFKETEEPLVTETVTPSMERADGDTSDLESAPVMEAPPEPDESSNMISDPVTAVPEQDPEPENDPEPSPLAESPPVPQENKFAESAPEAEPEQQTSPEPVMLQQPVDTEPPEEKAVEQEETNTEPQVMDPEADESAKEVEMANNVDTEPPSDEPKEKAAEIVEEKKVSPEKPEDKEQVPEPDVSPEKAAEMVDETKVSSESPADADKAAEVVDETKVPSEKPADAETAKEDAAPEKSETGVVKGADEAAPETEAVEPQPEKEEDIVPAPGSVSLPLLEEEQTKDLLRTSRTLIVLRGLPGSGKSFLARVIADTYKDHCTVICADNHGIKPESPDSCADGYKALDEAVVSCCAAGPTSPVLIVVDDTNHRLDRLARMGEVAKEHHLVAIFVEPKTAWCGDVAQLRQKTRRGLEEAQLETMKGQLVEMSIPLYFGFFLLSSVQDKIRCTSMDFLKTLDTLEAFKNHLMDFSGKAEQEVDLEQYFKTKGTLHCTTKFCDYGKAEGAKEYAQKPAVQKLYGSTFELSLSALFVTPRTFGAQVSLTEEQLQLWPDDAEKEAESSVPAAASLPLGSRAHVTLGCAEGVKAVQTGVDLLDILALKQDGQKGETVEMELGQLTYYGEGRWLLSLREPICAPACFSSFYKRRESTKKEPEKKKTKKCTIL